MQSSKNAQKKEIITGYSLAKLSDTEMCIKCSYPKMTGENDRQEESLTGQVRDQAGRFPLTCR